HLIMTPPLSQTADPPAGRAVAVTLMLRRPEPPVGSCRAHPTRVSSRNVGRPVRSLGARVVPLSDCGGTPRSPLPSAAVVGRGGFDEGPRTPGGGSGHAVTWLGVRSLIRSLR